MFLSFLWWCVDWGGVRGTSSRPPSCSSLAVTTLLPWIVIVLHAIPFAHCYLRGLIPSVSHIPVASNLLSWCSLGIWLLLFSLSRTRSPSFPSQDHAHRLTLEINEIADELTLEINEIPDKLTLEISEIKDELTLEINEIADD